MTIEAEIGLDTPTDIPVGRERIRACLRSLDNSPGVYRMLGEAGEVLYVGKAKALRNRVQSYLNEGGLSERISRMVGLTASMMFLTTNTETEALLLEQNLIKQLKPRFNVLLRDDKGLPYIALTGDHPFPRLKKHRGRKSEEGDFFGPFASAGSVNRTLTQLQRVFLLRSCSDSEFALRTRPCLLHQIKRCCAPCVGRVDQGEYRRLVRDAKDFLAGRSARIQRDLATVMEDAAHKLEFERAAAVRDRIQALTQVQAVQGINPRTVFDADIIGLHTEAGQACVQVFFIRAGQNWGNHAYFPRTGSGAEQEEVMQGFIGQFYDRKTPPPKIILSHPVEEPQILGAALSERRGRKVALLVPQRGEKAALVEAAVRNARSSLAQRLANAANQAKLLRGLADAFCLPNPPTRVEVYDNSHIQGRDQVGAMIVAGPDGFLKSSYRKFTFNDKTVKRGDDIGMMKDMVRRRFRRLAREDPHHTSEQWPNLVLIDGGAGQVAATMEVLNDLAIIDLPVIGIAKGPQRNAGREEFHRPDGSRLTLPSDDPVLYFLQRLRDEAHRFAIGAHRAMRSKSATHSPLLDIPGVGATRRRALLMRFGSAKAVTRAGLDDLKAVDGISDSLALVIYNHFHDVA